MSIICELALEEAHEFPSSRDWKSAVKRLEEYEFKPGWRHSRFFDKQTWTENREKILYSQSEATNSALPQNKASKHIERDMRAICRNINNYV